jgi:hypothetical protein
MAVGLRRSISVGCLVWVRVYRFRFRFVDGLEGVIKSSCRIHLWKVNKDSRGVVDAKLIPGEGCEASRHEHLSTSKF